MSQTFRNVKYEYLFFKHSLAQIGPLAWTIFVVSILSLLNYECKWLTVSANNGFLTGLNRVICQILYAYITGSVFYFFIEMIAKQKKTVALFRLANNNVFLIERSINTLINEICLKSGVSKGQGIDFNRFIEYCNSIDTLTPIKTIFYPPSNLKEFIRMVCDDIRRWSDQMIQQVELLDEKWTRSLFNMSDCLTKLENRLKWNIRLETLNLVGGDIWMLYAEIANLRSIVMKFTDKTFRQHSNTANKVIPPTLNFTVH
jgi:hypothetical protein